MAASLSTCIVPSVNSASCVTAGSRSRSCRSAASQPSPLLATSLTQRSSAWEISLPGSGSRELHTAVWQIRPTSTASRCQVSMGNKNAGKGVFAPIVVLVRNVIGKKEFNQLRGKGIALHSQVITEFCKSIGADAKQRQGLIRLAKKNGEMLGFLA